VIIEKQHVEFQTHYLSLVLFYVSCFFPLAFLLFYLCVTVECVGKLHQDLEINLIRIVLILISLPNMPPTISFNAAKMKESHIILGELPQGSTAAVLLKTGWHIDPFYPH